MAPDIDLLCAEAIADPHAFFRRIAAAGRVCWNARWGGWILTRHADVVAVLSDARFSADAFARFEGASSDPAGGSPPDHDDGAGSKRSLPARFPNIFRILRSAMVYRDPPDHARLRSLVSKAFTRRTVDVLRPRIADIVERLLDRAATLGRVDLVRELASPLPVQVIAELLGIPTEEGDRLKAWSDEVASLMLGSLAEDDRHGRADRGIGEMAELFRRVVAERRRSPRDDFTSALIAARDDRDLLTEDELVGMCFLMVFAGHETTTNWIANSVVALLDNPAQMELARSGLPKAALSELVRYDGPMKAISRIAREPVEIAGQRVEAGQRVLLALAAANRDPSCFAEPDRLDLHREENPHVAFGHGIHYCLGAPLAKLETEIALEALLRRAPGLTLDVPRSSLRWRPALLVRALEELPVLLG
jgi:cytochrome P450